MVCGEALGVSRTKTTLPVQGALHTLADLIPRCLAGEKMTFHFASEDIEPWKDRHAMSLC